MSASRLENDLFNRDPHKAEIGNKSYSNSILFIVFDYFFTRKVFSYKSYIIFDYNSDVR